MVPTTKSEDWPWGIWALLVFAALLIAGLVVFIVAVRCRGATPAARGPFAPEETTLLPQPQMLYAPQPQMQYAPQPQMPCAPPPRMPCAPPPPHMAYPPPRMQYSGFTQMFH